MSISSSLYVASGALDAFGNAISTAGDNIANVNTTSFKASRANFENQLSLTLSGGTALERRLDKITVVTAAIFGVSTFWLSANW